MKYLLNPISDIHCKEDLLGFQQYVDTLKGMITDPNFKTPFCIGIFGKWGSGKTSFMRLLEDKLIEDGGAPNAIPVWFNPWRYEKEEHLIIPFLKTIEYEIKQYVDERKRTGKKIIEGLESAAKKIGDASAAFAYGMNIECKLGVFGFTLDPSKAASREEELAKRRIEEAQKLSEKLSSIYYEIVDELKSAVDEKQFRIVAFIDDLDRCLPEKAVELLEAVKLFLDIQGYLFVIGVDREVVKKGISYRYRFFEQREEKEKENLIISPDCYLDKMIQLPLDLPKIESGRKKKFIEALLGNTKYFKEHADIIDIGVGDNPRTLKRFINLLAFTVRHAESVKANIIRGKVVQKESQEHKNTLRKYFTPLFYIKWVIIVFVYPDIHRDIEGNKRRLIELQDASREAGKTEYGGVVEAKADGVKLQVPDRLKKVLAKGEPFPDDPWLIDRFILLTESTVASEEPSVEARGYGTSYKPGDMVLIPKGKFLYGDEKIEKEIPYNYYIDVFPVTNAQYKAFIDETGHAVPFGESEESRPYNWDQDKRIYPDGMANHPVVLVSHGDVEEFCKWRAIKEGKETSPPTEEEWEKAARGERGRIYPWGDEFDFKKLNCADYHLNKILKDEDEWGEQFFEGFYKMNSGKAFSSEVGRFKGGESPFGCQDMSGNVWEWTDSFYDDNNEELYVLRGGSWKNYTNECRCANRLLGGNPLKRYFNVGFRCARMITL